MTEQRKSAKDGRNADPMAEMRKRYDYCVEADRENRDAALADHKFVTIPGEQWEAKQREARSGRPCYEFPILRSHWRQVVNDQKKARPGIKVRAVENGDAKGAELRQGLIRNIESRSNAERAYDCGFEWLTSGGFGCWEVATEYSSDDGWEQDICVKRVNDPLGSAWFDPDAKEADLRDAKYAFLEESLTRDAFKERFPDADAVDFEHSRHYGDWFGQEHVRVAKYWRVVPVKRTLWLLDDGSTVDSAEVPPDMAEAVKARVLRERVCNGTKVVVSLVSGKEELEGPFDTVFPRIPLVPIYANRFFVDGRWHWSGLVRPGRDAQRLANYNITTGQEALSKQHKAVPIVTPKMLEGKGVKAMWDKSNAVDIPYLPITPDSQMPGGPNYLNPPPVHAAFVQMGQMSIDLVKAATGIYDASLGARSNETSGKAIMARQNEGDTATFDYRDALAFGIQSTGEIILAALPKVYDTPRTLRVLGKDGAEDWAEINKPGPNGEVLNDLSAGKYDVTVTTGPAYDTQRMEFIDALVQLGQGNPAVAAAVPDLIVGAMDFPKADEAAERLKLMLPPPVQQAMAQKDQSPAVMQLQGQMRQMAQMAEQHVAQLQDRLRQAEAKADSKVADELKVAIEQEKLRIDWFNAETDRLKVLADAEAKRMASEQKDMHKAADMAASHDSAQRDQMNRDREFSASQQNPADSGA